MYFTFQVTQPIVLQGVTTKCPKHSQATVISTVFKIWVIMSSTFEIKTVISGIITLIRNSVLLRNARDKLAISTHIGEVTEFVVFF